MSILTLFLSLFTLSFSCILIFTYSKNYRSVLTLSKTIANETMSTIRAHFENISSSSERTSLICSGFLPTLDNISIDNPTIQNFFLQTIKFNPHFSEIYVGFPNGNFAGAIDLKRFSSNHTFLLEPLKPLPPDAAFVWRTVSWDVTPSVDHWRYLNAKFEEVASEVIHDNTFGASTRPWYEGATNSAQPYWTGFYRFFPTLQKGISLGTPVLNSQGEIIAVTGADLSMSLISNFLNAQKVGASGKAFLLDQNGKIIVPEHSSELPPNLVAQAYTQFLLHPNQSDLLIEFEGHSFLTFKSQLSHLFGTNWVVLVITPLEDFLGDLIDTQHQIFAFIFFILLTSIFVIILFSKRLSSPISILASEIRKIRDLDLSSHVRVRSNIQEIYMLDQAIASMRYVVSSFSKYVPKELVKKLFEMDKAISLGGEKKELTIFFSDVANFTTITESQPIDVLLPLVSEYFSAMTALILENGGTIDKFMGDGIMAFWGAPVELKNHAQKACDTALLCNAMLITFNQMRQKENKPQFPTRFGIHSGEVIVGNIGTEERMNYTVLGDAVNTTSRLQEVDKIYHTHIIISNQVQMQLTSDYITRPLDVVSVKGKTQKTKIYELVGKLGADPSIQPSEKQIALCQLFTEAHQLMEQGKTQEAKEKFQQISSLYPDDFPTRIYLERLQTI